MAGLPPVYDLIIVESYAGGGFFELMELTVKYEPVTHEEVTVPVKLLAKPLLDGVENELSVSLEDKSARVKLNQNVSDDAFKKAVQDAGYELTGIE